MCAHLTFMSRLKTPRSAAVEKQRQDAMVELRGKSTLQRNWKLEAKTGAFDQSQCSPGWTGEVHVRAYGGIELPSLESKGETLWSMD